MDAAPGDHVVPGVRGAQHTLARDALGLPQVLFCILTGCALPTVNR
jgi:hypothetical protein